MASATDNNSRSMCKAMPPEPTLRRLPWYLAYVSTLRSRNIEHVSSTQISRDLNVDASQIVKDLSFLSIKGKTRIGYNVADMENSLVDFLGFKRCHRAVIVGVGSLGAALLADTGLSRYGLNIVAAFDTCEGLIGTEKSGVRIHDVSLMDRVCRECEAEIGIITVPADMAQPTADRLVGAGIKALWNFTPFRLLAPAPGIVIQNISIYAHLAVMYNRLDCMKGGSADTK